MIVLKSCNQYLKGFAASNHLFFFFLTDICRHRKSVTVLFLFFCKIPLHIEKKVVFPALIEYPQCVVEVKIYNFLL